MENVDLIWSHQKYEVIFKRKTSSQSYRMSWELTMMVAYDFFSSLLYPKMFGIFRLFPICNFGEGGSESEINCVEHPQQQRESNLKM